MKNMIFGLAALALVIIPGPASARPVFRPALGCIGGHQLVFVNGWPRYVPC